jgi:hypothetical protein
MGFLELGNMTSKIELFIDIFLNSTHLLRKV